MNPEVSVQGFFMSLMAGAFAASLSESWAPAVAGVLSALVFLTVGSSRTIQQRWTRPEAPARWRRERKS